MNKTDKEYKEIAELLVGDNASERYTHEELVQYIKDVINPAFIGMNKPDRKIDWDTVELDGIEHSDYPDYCNAYISAVDWDDGTPLTDEEIDAIDSQTVYDLVWESLH